MAGLDMAWMRRNDHSVRARALVASVAVVAALASTGCGLRWETDASVFPSPDAVTVARDALADAEAGVLAAAAPDAATDATAANATTTAQAHLDVLGGAYDAYPGTTPSPSVSPAPDPTLSEAIRAARATAEDVAATMADEDADLAFLARSIDLDWALRELRTDRVNAGGPANGANNTMYFPLADASDTSSAGFAPDAATTTSLSEHALSELALKEDEARFAYETIAALEFDSLRQQALSRSRLHGERSDALASVLATDPRTPLYQLRDGNLPDPGSREALALSIELDLGARYAAALDGASATDATWLLNAAFDTYARSMVTEGFAPSDLPTLPGVAVIPADSQSTAAPAAPSPSAG